MARKLTAEERSLAVKNQRKFEPNISSENYKADLMRYLTHHGTNTDAKVIRKWALAYAKNENLDKASDFELRSIGIIGHAVTLDFPISLNDIVKIDDEVNSLLQKYAKKVTVVTKKPDDVPVISQDVKNAAAASKHAAEVNGALDDFLVKSTDFSMKAYANTHNISPAVLKLIAAKFTRLEAELGDVIAGRDSQLVESYSFMGKVKLKKFYAFVKQIITDCAQQVVIAKVRKPRARKEKPASVLASKMQYLKKFDQLGLSSEAPEKIIGADTVWVYDTERRKLTVYTADTGMKLGIKGTTITGFSVTNSATRMLRKPEIFFKGSLAKKTILSEFDKLTTKPSVPNGRTNETSIILRVF